MVVRDRSGRPSVLRNAPLLDDGTPMPTRYWLVDPQLRRAVDRLESAGGVRAAEAAVDPAALADAHARYAAERDAALPPGWDGLRPSGGVGGTRRGVKCLHAHLAWHLAGGDDPVGRWVEEQLAAGRTGSAVDDDPYDLARFVSAQEGSIEHALAELRAGRKTSHWMWWVFPQLRGLGSSGTAVRYGISGLDEATAFLAHPVLGPRLEECCDAILGLGEVSAEEVLGSVDAMKLRSSMTLFVRARPGDARFAAVLRRWYGGQPDPRTDRILGGER